MINTKTIPRYRFVMLAVNSSSPIGIERFEIVMKGKGEKLANDKVAEGLKLILNGIELLQKSFEHRKFTVDGRLVGDIGEIIAEAEFELKLDNVSRPIHDARAGRRDVQIKATFKDHLALRSVPDYLIGLKLNWDGTHEVVFNGPGAALIPTYGHRKGFGSKQLSLPLTKLRQISATIPNSRRIKSRTLASS